VGRRWSLAIDNRILSTSVEESDLTAQLQRLLLEERCVADGPSLRFIQESVPSSSIGYIACDASGHAYIAAPLAHSTTTLPCYWEDGVLIIFPVRFRRNCSRVPSQESCEGTRLWGGGVRLMMIRIIPQPM